jgi:hypothetical protein
VLSEGDIWRGRAVGRQCRQLAIGDAIGARAGGRIRHDRRDRVRQALRVLSSACEARPTWSKQEGDEGECRVQTE